MTDDDKRDKQRAALAQLIKQAIEDMPLQIELAQVQAKLTRVKYDALVKEGFTQEQALLLCKTP